MSSGCIKEGCECNRGVGSIGIEDRYLSYLANYPEAVVRSTDVTDSSSDPDLLSPLLWAMKCVFFLTVVSLISWVGLTSMGCLQETCGAAEDATAPPCGCRDVAASPQETACGTAVWRAS